MNNDLISREALKEKINFIFPNDPLSNYEEIIGEVMKLIDNAPTVEQEVYMTAKDYNLYLEGYKQGKKDFDRPTDKWIPVSERLPERYKEVIVTDIETEDTYCSWYHGNGYWECDNGVLKNRIIAWQSLPEPYKKGGAE